MPNATPFSRGSEWHKWDLHIHSPLSGLNNQFPYENTLPNWEAYIAKLESLGDIPVIGVTDYFSIDGYKKVLEFKLAGRLENIKLILPNIEFRIDKVISTTTGQRRLNYHVIFSDQVQPDQIEQHFLQEIMFCFQGDPQNTDYSFRLRNENLVLLGQRLKNEHQPFNDGRSDFEIGCTNATVSPADIKKVLRDKDQLFKGKYLIALPEENMSLMDWDGQYHQTRKTLLQGADVIFSGNPNTAKWASGQGSQTKEQFIKEFRTLKPCIHGSDAHKLDDIGKPQQNRFCHIKAELTFEGLKQIIFEPVERVFIGEKPAKLKNDYQVIDTVTISGSPDWFGDISVPLNQDLASTIGPRGSGKSALAEMIAFAGGSNVFRGTEALVDTFLYKASKKSAANHNPITGTKVILRWADGSTDESTIPFPVKNTGQEEKVKYLPQKFVEHLCAPENTQELEQEIERVIFQRNKKTERLNASNFQELRRSFTQAIETKRLRLALAIKALNQSIADTATRIEQDKVKKIERNRRQSELNALIKNTPALPEENKGEIARLETLEKEQQQIEDRIIAINQKIAATDILKARFEVLSEELKAFNENVADLLSKAGLSDPDGKFTVIVPTIEEILEHHGNELSKQASTLRGVATATDAGASGTLASVMSRIDALKQASQLTQAKRREFEKFQQDRKRLEDLIATLDRDLKEIEDVLKPKLVKDQNERLERYLDAVELLAEERGVLEGLYQPLKDALSGSNETAKKLMFFSRTNFDVIGHAARGMELFDRRKSTFKDNTELEEVLAEFFDTIQQADFGRDAVRDAIQKLRDRIVTPTNPIREQLRKDHPAKDFADWLYSTDAYSVSYGIKFDNKDLKYLSPGEKGIVLLLLYLEAEEEDNRPLIVDQPDDNLDNLSVYPNLIEYFRDRKRTRQIIIITHNPNLVVTTDSEQVIVGAFDGIRTPKIQYRSGALEDTGKDPLGIREEVCRILEGGTEAFQVRESRYAIDRG
jgi:energy-coupling factor transporter ATP-binding protein EcfA2